MNPYLQKVIIHQNDKNKHGKAEQFARDAEAEKGLGSPNVTGRRRCVSRHDESLRDIDEAKAADDAGQ